MEKVLLSDQATWPEPIPSVVVSRLGSGFLPDRGAIADKGRRQLQAIRSDDQLVNRFEAFPLPLWTDNEAYRRLLATLKAVLPLRRPSGLARPKLASKIISAAEGVLGEIIAVVMRAAVLAVQTGAESISVKLIDQADFVPPSERRRVAVSALQDRPCSMRATKNPASAHPDRTAVRSSVAVLDLPHGGGAHTLAGAPDALRIWSCAAIGQGVVATTGGARPSRDERTSRSAGTARTGLFLRLPSADWGALSVYPQCLYEDIQQ